MNTVKKSKSVILIVSMLNEWSNKDCWHKWNMLYPRPKWLRESPWRHVGAIDSSWIWR